MERGLSQTSVRLMPKQESDWPYLQHLIYALNDGDHGKRAEFCGRFLQIVDQGKLNIDRILKSIRQFLN